ncbi:MAG: RDD family protein [Bacteroidota bacterium]
MSKIKIPTSFNIELEFAVPDFHKRFLAWLIDLAILTAYAIVLSTILESYSHSPKNDGDLSTDYNISFLGLILYAPVLLYHLICEVIMNGQSIGKKIFRIKVISETGGKPALHQFMIRWLLRVVDFTMTLGVAGLFAILASKKNQRLGDMAAGTIVIQEDPRAYLSDTVFLEIEDNYKPRYPEAVMRLSDKDMNLIKTILDTATRTGNYQLASRTSDKIRNMAGITEYQSDTEFLETILKDYNFLASQG